MTTTERTGFFEIQNNTSWSIKTLHCCYILFASYSQEALLFLSACRMFEVDGREDLICSLRFTSAGRSLTAVTRSICHVLITSRQHPENLSNTTNLSERKTFVTRAKTDDYNIMIIIMWRISEISRWWKFQHLNDSSWVSVNCPSTKLCRHFGRNVHYFSFSGVRVMNNELASNQIWLFTHNPFCVLDVLYELELIHLRPHKENRFFYDLVSIYETQRIIRPELFMRVIDLPIAFFCIVDTSKWPIL